MSNTQEETSSKNVGDVEKGEKRYIWNTNGVSNEASNMGSPGSPNTTKVIPIVPSPTKAIPSTFHLDEETVRSIIDQIKTELEEESEGAKLSEDTYSIMKVTNSWTSYLLSLLVWLIQLALYGMILLELIERPEVFGTEFNIPFRTSNSTSVGQFIAILFAIAEVPDLIMWSGVKQKDNKDKRRIVDLPNYLQFIMGLVAVGISCILILQSKDIIEVFANFAAMNIIAQFDDMVYTFCSKGIFGATLKKDTETVESSYKDEKIGNESGKCIKMDTICFFRAVMLVLVLAMSVGLGFLCYGQYSNIYFKEMYPSCNLNITLMKYFGDGICDTSRDVMNNYRCGFEGGDCFIFDLAYPDCNATRPKEVGDGICQPELNHDSCGWDGGDCCPWLNETNKETYEEFYGDEKCHAIFNTAECLYDKGDCLSFNMEYANFTVPETTTHFEIDNALPTVLGDGNCSLAEEYMIEYMNEESGWAFGDCKGKVNLNNTRQNEYPHCRQQDLFKIGNGKCDKDLLTDSCGWDELDCCTLDQAKVKDGLCDKEYLTQECGYDGYDCCDHQKKLRNGYCNDYIFNFAVIGAGENSENLLKEMKECGYDDFDCEDKCIVKDPQLLGNGECDGGYYNTKECKWDYGDCDEHNRLFPNCKLYKLSTFNDGKCDTSQPGQNTAECGYDGGDCIEYNAKYSDCDANNPNRVGDGFCHKDLNTSECLYDGGDCIGVEKEFNRKYPNCNVQNPVLIGDGNCDRRKMDFYGDYDYNTRECGWDGGDCLSSNAQYYAKYGECSETQIPKVQNGECDEESNTYYCKWDGGDCLPGCDLHDLNIAHIRNGICDEELNTIECLHDGGDCLEDCEISEFGLCSQHGNSAGANCLWGFGECLRETGCEFKNNELHLIGDGRCDQKFNTSECGFDKGDCT